MSSTKYKILDLVFTTLFTFLVVFLTMCVIRDDERVFRNLHAYENGGSLANNPIPTSYFALDWIVHPITRHFRADRVSEMYEMHIPVENDACYSSGMTWSNGDCGPALWQQSDFCPGKNMKIPESTQLSALRFADVANPATAGDILSQLYEKGGDGKRSMQRGDTLLPGAATVVPAYWWRNSNMADVCRIERIMDMNVFLNDDTTWSIAASHSTTVLLWGAAIVMWVANVGDLMTNNKSFVAEMSSLRKMKYILLVAPLAVLLFLRITAKTQSSTGVDSARLLPNGSYFYVFLMTTLSSYIIVSIDGTAGDDEKDQQFRGASASETGKLTDGENDDANADGKDIPMTPDFKMNLSGFVKMKQSSTNLNAYMPRTGSENSTLSFSQYSDSEVLDFKKFDRTWEVSSDYFSTAQLYAFPLLTLGVYMTGTNYQVDSTLQHLFLASSLYGVIDVAVYRLKQMIVIVSRLSTDAADNIVGRVIELVGLILQGFIFVFIFMLMHWNLSLGNRLTLPLNGEKSLQAYIETYSSWSYLVFFTLSTFVKCTALIARNDLSKENSATATTAVYQSLNSIYNNRKSILFFLLNAFVGVLLALLTASLMSDKYTKGLPTLMDPVAQNNVLKLYRQYRSGWFEHA